MTAPWSHTFTIFGRPTSYKNGKQGFVRPPGKGKPSVPCPHCGAPVVADVAKSPQATHWFKKAVPQIEAQWTYRAISKKTELDLAVVAYFPTTQTADCTSIIDGVQDALEAAGVVENDSCIIPIDTVRLTRRKRPRVEATITLTRERKQVDRPTQNV